MRARNLLLLFAPLLLSSCQDERLLTPEPASMLIQHGGASGFYFLPPIASQSQFTGTANPNLQPVVEICARVGSSEDQCADGAVHLTFSGSAVQQAGGHYKVNWRTDQPGSSPETDADNTYRVFVRIGTLALGWADVELTSTNGQAKKTGTNEVITLLDGRTLPIEFRIEFGAIQKAQQAGRTGSCNCAEQTIANTGGDRTLTTDDGGAGAEMPDGWLNDYGLASATVIIQRREMVDGKCLVTSVASFPLEQQGGCFEFSTFPILKNGFSGKQARVDVCLEGDVNSQEYDLYKYSSFGPEAGINKLEEAQGGEELAPCAPPSRLAALNHPLGRLAATGWNKVARPLAQLIGPTPLYAGDTGAGGLTGSFSTVFYARTPYMSVAGSEYQFGMPGDIIDVAALVASGHHCEQYSVESHPNSDVGCYPLSGVPVTFSVVEGGGKLLDASAREVNSVTVLTAGGQGETQQPLGTAVAQWKLGRPGPQVVRATTPWGGVVDFNAWSGEFTEGQ